MNMLEKFFNWRKNPGSVFYFAIPLAVIGFGLITLRGVFELSYNGDPWYLVIALFGVALLVLALWPIRHLINQKP